VLVSLSEKLGRSYRRSMVSGELESDTWSDMIGREVWQRIKMSLSYVDALAFAIMWMTAANFIAQKEFSDGGTRGAMGLMRWQYLIWWKCIVKDTFFDIFNSFDLLSQFLL
jgi:hypothetical protein